MSNPSRSIKAEAEFVHHCILYAEVESNGLKGGDSGHGSKTRINIKCGPGDITFSCTGDSVTIDAGGDSELLMLRDALQHVVGSLNSVISPTHNG